MVEIIPEYNKQVPNHLMRHLGAPDYSMLFIVSFFH